MIDHKALQLALRTYVIDNLTVALVDDTAVTFDEYAVANYSGDQPLNNVVVAYSQSVQHALGYSLLCDTVTVRLKKVGSPTGTLTVGLYAATGTHGINALPTGAALASATLDVSTLTTSYESYDFALLAGTVPDATTRCVVISYSGGTGSDFVRVGSDSSSPTHSGNLGSNNGSTWQAVAGIDLLFTVTGIPAGISVSGSTYTRAVGSFLTDGFAVGMEVTGAGFTNAANNQSVVVTGVEALTLTVDATLTTESAAAGRTLTVGQPTRTAWENVAFETTVGYPWIEEQLVPAGTRQITIGQNAQLETRVLYSLLIHAVHDTGLGAPSAYADAVLDLFSPGTQIAFGSETARVRTDTGPSRGQMLVRRPGWVTVPITIPLEIWSTNA